jgi:hypothetical protein
MSPSVNLTRHHRKRRFHVHPRALGAGFGIFDLDPPTPPASSPDPEAVADESELPNPAKRGIWICAKILLALGGLLLCRWFLMTYAWEINDWAASLSLFKKF